jgi:hypothetical protein
VPDRRVKNTSESGIVFRKSKSGDESDCSIVELVERTALGGDRKVLVVMVKSFVPGDLFCVEIQPRGRAGIVRVSNAST